MPNTFKMKFIYTLYCSLLLFPFVARAQSIEFIENRGQWDGPFQYKAITGRGDVFLEKNTFTYLLGDPSNVEKMDAAQHGQLTQPQTLKYHVYKVHFEGANENPEITGSKSQTNYYNYFLGNDSTRWKTNIHPYLDIDYTQLYKGINMHISSDKGNMVYDFEVQPDADAGQVRMKYDGTDDMRIKDGDLYITTSVGPVYEMKPYAYQYINDARVEVPCRYKLRDNVVTFVFPHDYDHSKLLVIDPTVVFCTFTGSTADNWGFTATYDQDGNMYLGGLVNTIQYGGSYPVSPGAFQVTFGGGSPNVGSNYPCDMAIMKLNSTGTTRIYATYIGGSSNEQPHSLIVDANDNLIIAGRTYSSNYPVTSGAYDNTYNGGADIVVTKLNATGTALIGSTFMGGTGEDGVNFDPSEYVYGNLKHNYGDDARSEVLVDNSGNIYVAGSSQSSDFPVTTGSSTISGAQDGVVMKFNSTLTNLLWSQYIGGSSDDAAYVLALDSAQTHLFVGGGTMSTNFPATTGTLHPNNVGGTDGFIVKFLNSPPYSLQAGTYLGTANYDQCYGLQVDHSNNVYAMGQSLGGTFPVTSGVYNNPNSSQFIIKLDNNLSSDLFSTVYGSGDPNHTNISPVAFLVDTCENIYISGWGGNLAIAQMPATVGTTNGMPVTPNAVQPTTDGFDFYFICLSKNAQSLLYATYYGRTNNNAAFGEHVDGGTSRFDKDGVVYQAICAACGGNFGYSLDQSHFPTTPGVWSMADSSADNCNEAGLKIAFELGPVTAHATATPNTTGCAPFTVQFNNTSTNAVNYTWDFGDGTAQATTYSPQHTFQNPGTYHVRLVADNSNACTRVIDTAYLTIVVDTDNIHPQFTYQLVDSCNPYIAAFTNISQYSSNPNSATTTTFHWDFGDGTSFDGITPPQHSFPQAGSYTVTLTMTDTLACNSPDTVQHSFTFSNLRVTSAFTSPDTICQSSTVTFTNNSTNGQNYQWTFGDGQSSTDGSPTHTFTATGTYTVTLVVTNPAACNGVDSFSKMVTIISGPTADFSFSPTTPITNTPISFTNLSVNATRYNWDFGDGTNSTVVSPSHLYKRTGMFNVCLTAYNSSNCPSVVCKTVATDIQPLADLPTAFSPNGDGSNDILYVRGAAIETMDLKVYNRWGQMVFETTNQEIGWDGTYKGQPQEMDAYAWVLKVQFTDGTTLTKKGNVTLLR